MMDRLPIDPSHSREILTEVMEELLLLGAIEALDSVLGYKYESPSEGEIIPVQDIVDTIADHKKRILHLRRRLYPKRKPGETSK